jgi:hypothetical protein
MNCAEFVARMNDQFAGSGLQGEADLADHRAHCQSCHARWEEFILLSDAIGAWRRETPDVDLVPAVVAALGHSDYVASAESRTDSRFPMAVPERRRRLPALAIVGGAAVLFVVAMLNVGRPVRQPPNPVAQTRFGHHDPAAQNPSVSSPIGNDEGRPGAATSNRSVHGGDSTPQHTRSLPAQVETDRVAYLELAQRAAGALGQMTMLVLPDQFRPPDSPQVNATQELPLQGTSGWMDDVEDQLKPVGRSLGNAFDFLWRAGESVDG